MTKLFRLSKLYFALQNQRSSRLPIAIGMDEIALPCRQAGASGKNRYRKYDKVF